MKILMLLDNGYDPDVRVYKEAQYLVSKGIDVTILCWDRDKGSTRLQDECIDGVHILRIRIPSQYGSGKKQLSAYIKFAFTCRSYMQKHQYDFIHCHDLGCAVIGCIARNRRIPYIFDMHEYYEKSAPLRKNNIHALIIYLINHSYASLYENDIYLDPAYSSVHSKLYPLKNYPDSRLIKRNPKKETNVFRIGYHGSVRNQIDQFSALFEAVKGLSDVRVDINGSGIDLPQLYQLEKKYDNVHINGPFNGTTALTNLYQNTHVLFCGYDRNDPNMQGTAEIVKYFEAILTGTPMIAAESLAVGIRVKKYGFGLAVDTDSADAIRTAILKLKNDHNFWQQCSENELAQAWKYDWNEAVKILDKVYSL